MSIILKVKRKTRGEQIQPPIQTNGRKKKTSAVSYYKRYALGTLFKDCACKYVSQPCLNMLSGLFFFAFAGLYPERRKLSVGETRARSLILPTGFHLFYFLEGGVSSGHFSLYFYFQDILLPVWLHIAAMEDAAPSTSPEFHFRQCLSSSILLSSPFSFHPGPLLCYSYPYTQKAYR